jgi:hypothetical protein
VTTNEELIAEAREAAPLAMTPEYQAKLLRKLADALESVSAPVEVTERERVAALIMDSPETEFYRQENATPWKTALRIADSILAGFRAPAADGDATAESALAEVERRLRLSDGYAPQDRIRFALQHVDAYRMGSARAPAADTVTTVEELDALPKDSILKSGTGIAYVKTPSGWRSIYDDRSTPSDVLLEPWYASQPLTVLYRPVESEEGAA